MYQPQNETEKQKWNAELECFAFQAPNPQAPVRSPERQGWGIPDEVAPRCAIEHIIRKYREEQENLHVHDRTAHRHFREIKPQVKVGLILISQAHFLWLRTVDGARWLMRMCGMEEVHPFYEGYTYILRDQQKTGTQIPEPAYDQNGVLVQGVELRIFRKWDWDADASMKVPCSRHSPQVTAEMVALMTAVRSPYARSVMPEFGEDWFQLVSSYFVDWFEHGEKRKAEDTLPTEWVQRLKKPGTNERFYEALNQIVEKDTDRIYKIRDPQGNGRWLTRQDIVIAPNTDIDRVWRHMPEADVTAKYQCTSCRHTRPCAPYTQGKRLCCHCYSQQVDPPARPTLDRCTMNVECKACPERIDSEAMLTRIKNMWNAERRGPVPR